MFSTERQALPNICYSAPIDKSAERVKHMRIIKLFGSRKAGFTMTEMVVTIAVIAILAGMMIPFFSATMNRSTADADDAYQKLNEANADITHKTLPTDSDPTITLPGADATTTVAPASTTTKAPDATTTTTAKPDEEISETGEIVITNYLSGTATVRTFTQAFASDMFKSKFNGGDENTITHYSYTSLELKSDIKESFTIPQTNPDGTKTAVNIYLNGHTIKGNIVADGLANIYGGSKDNPRAQMGTIDASDMTSALECTGGLGKIDTVKFIGRNFGINLYDGIIMNSDYANSDAEKAGIFNCICQARYDLNGSAGIYSTKDFRRIENTVCTGYYGFRTSASLTYVYDNTFIGYKTGYYKSGGSQERTFKGNICIGETGSGISNYGSWNANIYGSNERPSIIIGKEYGIESSSARLDCSFGQKDSNNENLFIKGTSPAVAARDGIKNIYSGIFVSYQDGRATVNSYAIDSISGGVFVTGANTNAMYITSFSRSITGGTFINPNTNNTPLGMGSNSSGSVSGAKFYSNYNGFPNLGGVTADWNPNPLTEVNKSCIYTEYTVGNLEKSNGYYNVNYSYIPTKKTTTITTKYYYEAD